MKFSLKRTLPILLPVAVLLVAPSCSRSSPSKKMIILGVDGLDPRLLQQFLDEGHLPNFERLITQGDFKPLETTMPPLSPVAWSSFITSMDSGGHGIFDFLSRDPETITPQFSMSRAVSSDWTISLGSWVIPLSSGRIEQLRLGRAFWEILEEQGVPSTVFRMPVNFPPSPLGRSFSGMGTPDILGTPGTFSFYTDNPPANADNVSGGQIIRVQLENHKVQAQLVGPENTFRRQAKGPSAGRGGDPEYVSPKLTIDFQVFLDPQEGVAKFLVQDDEFVLKEGEWSDWVRLDFEAVPYLVNVSAIGRFYLQAIRPTFRLYVTPLQINPEEPVMPISNPESWAAELHRELGYFYTQELPEDTKAFSTGIFNGLEFWEQLQFVFKEQRKALDHVLKGFNEGLLFFYFSTIDQGCHMLWRYTDSEHPGFVEDPALKDSIRVLYQQLDEVIGQLMQFASDDTALIVMSDHGFGPFYRGVNLNSWLAEQGYVRLKDPSRRDGLPLFLNVEWSATKAYALGLNSVYVNLRGREKNGIVSPGTEYQELLDRLENDLLAMTDPSTGRQSVTLVVQTQRDFHGDNLSGGPDIVVGYNWAYRSSWESPLGEFPRELFIDNDDPWSGDHSIDHRLVPGVLVANRKITSAKPTLQDLTVAVLNHYGIEKLPEMIGRNCLE